MKLQLINTPHGLVPMYDSDFDEKKKLVIGQAYLADIRVPRNINFHRKAFALLNTAWMLLPEKTQNGFRSIEAFRESITVAAGYVEVFWDIKRKEYLERAKSWSFDSMDNAEFGEMYERLKDVIWGILSVRISITQEVFEQYLSNY